MSGRSHFIGYLPGPRLYTQPKLKSCLFYTSGRPIIGGGGGGLGDGGGAQLATIFLVSLIFLLAILYISVCLLVAQMLGYKLGHNSDGLQVSISFFNQHCRVEKKYC